jgi:hypothetical protein
MLSRSVILCPFHLDNIRGELEDPWTGRCESGLINSRSKSGVYAGVDVMPDEK